MDKNCREIVEIVDNFRKLINEVEQEIKIQEAIVKEADQAFGDVRHFCEIDYPTSRTEKTKVCKLIKEYSDKRRQAKNIIAILKPLQEAINGQTKQVIGRSANEMVKELKRQEGTLIYVPRVLTSLFENGDGK